MMKYLLIVLAVGLAISTQVAYMDEILPPEYNLPWEAREDYSLRSPTSRVYVLPNGKNILVARRMTASNSPMVMGTVTPFDIAAGTDDGLTFAFDSSYPPACLMASDTDMTIGATKTDADGDFVTVNSLMRWDTSSIDDAAVVTDATLTYTVTALADEDGRNLNGEWYAGSNWPIDCTDHVDEVGTDAFSEDLTTVTSPVTLGTLSGIDLTDYTGLMVGISGGQPATGLGVGENNIEFDASESGSDLLLTVTFESACAVSCILQATGVVAGEHLVEVIQDGNTFELYVDDVLEDSLTVTGPLVDNSNDWQMFTNNAMPYVEYVTGSQSAALTLWYQFDELPGWELEDRSGTGNDTTARFPDTPSGIDVTLLPLTDSDDGTVGATGSAVADFIPAVGALTGNDPTEGDNVPTFDNLFDAPKVVIYALAGTANMPYEAMLIIVAFLVTCGIGVGAYAAFRKGFIMYIAMIIGSMFWIFYGDGIWGWIVPITFTAMCSPFLVKELRT